MKTFKKEIENNKIKGMFWHCHHDRLCEYVYDYQKRIDYIKKDKPKNEIKTRLKLFKKIKGKLPKKLEEANEKREEANEKWEEAYKKLEEAYKKRKEVDEKWEEAHKKMEEAYKKRKEADEKWEEADEKWKEVYKKYLPEMEKLHKKECGCKEWDGKNLVFKQEIN